MSLFSIFKTLGAKLVKESPVIHLPVAKVSTEEQVLCFDSWWLDQIGRFQGFVKDQHFMKEFAKCVLQPDQLFYVPRAEAEKNEAYKQVIPYTILRRNNHVFRYQRTKNGGEARLHDLWSLGVGGHINSTDGDNVIEAFERAYARELAEEVAFTCSLAHQPEMLGFINDDSNEVGRVHFGIVYSLQVGFAQMKFRDTAIGSGSFHEPPVLRTNFEKYENWSKFIIETLF